MPYAICRKHVIWRCEGGVGHLRLRASEDTDTEHEHSHSCVYTLVYNRGVLRTGNAGNWECWEKV
jgi:hypothetical protein